MAKKSRKIETIEDLTDELETRVAGASRIFFDEIEERFVSKLKLDGSRIRKIASNLALITQIDKAYKEFSDKTILGILDSIKKGSEQILKANVDYYGKFADNAVEFRKVTAKEVKDIVYKRLGLNEDGSLIKAGYMDGLFQDVTVKNQIKDFAFRNVLSSNGLEDFRSKLKEMIMGDKKRLGAFEKFYNTFAYDIYAKIDRMNSFLYADRLGMEYFIYDGGLIATSRQFCRDKSGLVFWIKEAEAYWPTDPNLPKIADYIPMIDMGGPNCRHTPRFISKELAFQLRPELATMPDPTNPPL